MGAHRWSAAHQPIESFSLVRLCATEVRRYAQAPTNSFSQAHIWTYRHNLSHTTE